jgi:hypothetical protein
VEPDGAGGAFGGEVGGGVVDANGHGIILSILYIFHICRSEQSFIIWHHLRETKNIIPKNTTKIVQKTFRIAVSA